MVMDWNPIVSAGVGGLVGVLGSYVTQRAQTSREIRKMLEERGAESALKVLDGINGFHSIVVAAAHEAELQPEYYHDWPDGWLEQTSFIELINGLRVDVLLIPSSSTRKRVASVVDALGSSWYIGRQLGVDGDLVAIELSEHARDVIGYYLRSQRRRPTPWRIRNYLRVHRSWNREWDKKRKAQEKEKKRVADEQRKRFEKEGPPPLPPFPTPEKPPNPTDPSSPKEPPS